MEVRIDLFMVEKGMVNTRSQARMLIKQGDVFCNGKLVKKPGFLVKDSDEIKIDQEFLYVSRGALKLVKAIDEFGLDFNDKIIADCGASTGGFTQVSLMKGAKKVYSIDVGHNQLSEILKTDDRVENMEGVNLKHPLELSEKVDFCVADISFISIKKVFPTMWSLLKEEGSCVVLIKPQFEAGSDRIGKNGIVKEEYLQDILVETKNWFKENNYNVFKWCESPIKGKTGNTEYLALIKGQQDNES